MANGVITFTNGLATAGSWVAYLLENDGYTKLASVAFTTTPAPSITTDKAFYALNEAIQVTFGNGPGNAKDWVGIYPEGSQPGGPASTLWNYVNGTQTSTTGKTNGTIVFPTGLSTAGRWVAYFLEDDGYTKLASVAFSVGAIPAVRTEHSTYFVSTSITVTFTNGPANPKDRIAIYSENITPGAAPAILTQFTDGNGGQTGKSHGSVTFPAGIANAGTYVAYLLLNGGNDILTSNKFSVIAADAPLLWLDKRLYETRQPIAAFFTNAPGNARDWVGIYPVGVTPGDTGSTIWLYLDGTQAGNDVFVEGNITFANGLNRAGDWVAYLLENDGYTILARETFTTVAPPASPTNNIILGTPLYFENFDSIPEGQVPPGWSVQSFTEVLDENFDLADLNSKSYANWLVISANRFRSSLLSYNAHTPTDDYLRVLSTNLENVVNGVVVTNLASGNILFGDSGYRDGRSQVIFALTPEYNLTGKTNVYLSFHSLYEQNQDSIGALEYTVDGGTNWLPIIYLLARNDILTNEAGQVDAVTTFTTEYTDVAFFTDPATGEDKGGTYGTFIAAPITQALAPFISARVDDDPFESKRVEYLRVAQADNQARVRFRFAYAGTDSWYWGIDDFGIYGSSSSSGGVITLSIARAGAKVTISWTGGNGRLQKSPTLSPGNWQDVPVPANTFTISEDVTGSAAFYRVISP